MTLQDAANELDPVDNLYDANQRLRAEVELLRAAMQESLRQIHLSHPQEPGCMPGCGPLHVALLG